jgi:G:T/U-mismatch repair DNA glycosylase
MKTINHRFVNRKIDKPTKILIIGTFNPESKTNLADFFYGRSHNYLWRIMPFAFGSPDLKGKPKELKIEFIKHHRIDFIDLISSVEIDDAEEKNYRDAYLDEKQIQWRDVITEIRHLKDLQKVCFTRKSFSDIPNMKIRINEIEDYCQKNGIHFQYLSTPARYYNEEKQKEWTKFLMNDN